MRPKQAAREILKIARSVLGYYSDPEDVLKFLLKENAKPSSFFEQRVRQLSRDLRMKGRPALSMRRGEMGAIMGDGDNFLNIKWDLNENEFSVAVGDESYGTPEASKGGIKTWEEVEKTAENFLDR